MGVLLSAVRGILERRASSATVAWLKPFRLAGAAPY